MSSNEEYKTKAQRDREDKEAEQLRKARHEAELVKFQLNLVKELVRRLNNND